MVAAPLSGCEAADTSDPDDDDTNEAPRKRKRKRRSTTSASATPLGEISIEAPNEPGGAYRVDLDAVVQVLALVSMDAIPATEVAEGYRLDRVVKGSVLELAGLEEEDVVTHVNGAPVLEPDALRKAYALMDSSKVIALTIRRGENTTLLNYKVGGRRGRLSSRSRPSTSSKRSSKVPEEVLAGIRKVSASRYEVSRAALAKIPHNPDDLMRKARLLPHREGGKVVGMKLYGIRRSSLLAAFGFKNGDRVEQVNETLIVGLASALEAHKQLSGRKKHTVQLTRRGKKVRLEYTVVD